jgi:16S rRNA (guanine(966)-N(2))-methyltransferase RsmD
MVLLYFIAMRIIAGSKRGMKLLSPKTQVSRPITDRVKESLFSVLCNYDLPEGALVTDLFCGVGSLGLEALSRGAIFVTFIEQDPKIITILKQNIDKAGLIGQSKVVRANAFKIGAAVDTDAEKCSLVFVDPPYSTTQDVRTGSALNDLLVLLGGQVADNGIVVVRTEQKVSLLEQYGRFRVIEQRRWGTMVVTILRRTIE